MSTLGVLSEEDVVLRAGRIAEQVRELQLSDKDAEDLSRAALGEGEPHIVLYEPESEQSLASVLLEIYTIAEQSRFEVVALREGRVLRVRPNECLQSIMRYYLI